jgi:hypothetical protein
MRGFAVAVLIVAAAATPLCAQTTADGLQETVGGTVQIEQETQRQRDDWATEQAELEARYRTAKANVKYLQERITSEEGRVAALNESIAELERRMGEARTLQNSLQDTLDMTMLRFERFVENDLPFLADEREQRLESLRGELARPEVTGAEKLRRLLEAMQVETEYGKVVAVDQDEITVDGEPLFVDVLRVGRVSLFWRTPDGEKVGTFDRGTWEWVELPASYERSITIAIEMASRLRPVQLIDLPLGRIQR